MARPVVFLAPLTTPPMPSGARQEAGWLLRQVQNGQMLSLPESRPMPSVGPRVHELRIDFDKTQWRVIYRIDPDAIVVAHVFPKKTQATPKKDIEISKKRFTAFDNL